MTSFSKASCVPHAGCGGTRIVMTGPIDMPQRFFSSVFTCAALLACSPLTSEANAASAATQRRQLQTQQHQDALNLHLQQSIRARRYDLNAADERRLDQLQLQQRLEQQQLEQQQLQRDRLSTRGFPSEPPGAHDAQLAAQREIFMQERQLQLQRFDMEQRQLLNSVPRQPLQPGLQPGQLTLP
jgi:hypothetical protein